MADSIHIIFDEDGVAREYDDTYDITIHCESQEEQDAVLEALKWKPEIIYCKDCKYSVDYYNDGACYCRRPGREMVWQGRRWDFFCAAGRKKGEDDD